MRFTETLATVVLAASTMFATGCSDSDESETYSSTSASTSTSGDPPVDIKETPEESPQVKFAEWFVENGVMYFGAPQWCPPCRLFQYDLTPEGWEILSKDNFVECSTFQKEPFSKECKDAGVYNTIPSFSAPWLEKIVEGYYGLDVLGEKLGYPGYETL